MGHVFDTQDRTKMIAWGLIAFGVILLLGIGNLVAVMLFTFFLILPGMALLGIHKQHEATAPLAIPGAVMVGTGALLIFQSITNYWESWAYAWTLYGTFIGYGLLLMGKRLDENTLVKIGRGMMVCSTVAFGVLGLMFVILSSGLLAGLFFPAAMIAAGAYLLFRGANGSHYWKHHANSQSIHGKITHHRIHINTEQEAA